MPAEAESVTTPAADDAAAAGRSADTTPDADAPRSREGLRAIAGRWETLLVALFIVLLPIGQAISPEFLTSDSFTTGSLDFSEIALMALPLTLVVVAAEIDLSVASVLGLSSALMATLWNGGVTVFESSGACDHVPFPDPVTTNICFGGADMQDAWVTCSSTGRLYKVRWPRPGLKLAFNV